MKILVHACCGPCVTYIADSFNKRDIEYKCLYFNPNIHPIDEHVRRKEALLEIGRQLEFDVECDDLFLQEKWEQWNGTMDERCDMCYESRLRETAKRAREQGYDAITTSLLISPYQAHDRIKEIAQAAADEFGVEFYYEDFREHFREGQRMARGMQVYMQKYCGCICSLNGNGR